jgi:hypothetical protein
MGFCGSELVNVGGKMGAKEYVRSGPQLWVSQLLFDKGNLSTGKIWDEYVRDKQVDKTMIPSKTFLKERVLYNMQQMSKIKKARAIDMPEYSKGGWALHQQKAFRNVCP